MAHQMTRRSHSRLFVVTLLTTSVLFTTARTGLALAGPTAADNAGSQHTQPQPNTFIVKLDIAAGGNINTINQRYGTTTVEAVAWVDGAYLVRAPSGSDADKVRKKVEHDKQVVYAELDTLGVPPEADPSSVRAWGMPTPDGYLNQEPAALLGLVQAHQYTRGAGSVVAVIDTGIQLDHPMLAGSLVPGYDFVDNDAIPVDMRNGLDDDGNGSIDETYGHGTHIAGIVYLVAPEAKIMPIRVLDADGNGSVQSIASAIAFAEKNGATVINLSLGAPVESQLMRDVILQATRKGVVVVAAAGNIQPDDKGRSREERQYPGMDTCVLAVTSLGQANTHSSFGNYGKWVDFAAPGEGIYSAFPDNQYAHWSGTSMATPFIAGQVALLKSLMPSLNVLYAANLMADTAYDVDALKPNKKFKDKIGVGLVHIGDSVERLSNGNWQRNSSKIIDKDCVP